MAAVIVMCSVVRALLSPKVGLANIDWGKLPEVLYVFAANLSVRLVRI